MPDNKPVYKGNAIGLLSINKGKSRIYFLSKLIKITKSPIDGRKEKKTERTVSFTLQVSFNWKQITYLVPSKEIFLGILPLNWPPKVSNEAISVNDRVSRKPKGLAAKYV